MATIDTMTAMALAMRDLQPRILACRDEIEQGRRLPLDLVREMAQAGLFRMLVPAAYGGLEVDLATALSVIEEVSQADGSAGWCVMIGASSGVTAAYLPETAAQEIYGSDPDVVTGGAVRPDGRAVAVEGGYRVIGRWAFASGSQHCAWLAGGCVVFDGDAPRMGPGGIPETRLLFFPASECEIIDTWSTGGLRGTGSHDFTVRDLFVPEARSTSLLFSHPIHDGRLYALPFFGVFAAMVAAVPLGIARGAIDALTELAAKRVPTGSRNVLREKSMIQASVARAEAILSGGRAFLYETVNDLWESVSREEAVTLEQRTRLRLASTHAATCAAQAVDLMYEAGGASAIYTTNPLERAFRDVHTANQHVLVQPVTWEMTGRALLGLDPGTPIY
jgi:indole-3-acetate monooxygenase